MARRPRCLPQPLWRCTRRPWRLLRAKLSAALLSSFLLVPFFFSWAVPGLSKHRLVNSEKASGSHPPVGVRRLRFFGKLRKCYACLPFSFVLALAAAFCGLLLRRSRRCLAKPWCAGELCSRHRLAPLHREGSQPGFVDGGFTVGAFDKRDARKTCAAFARAFVDIAGAS